MSRRGAVLADDTRRRHRIGAVAGQLQLLARDELFHDVPVGLAAIGRPAFAHQFATDVGPYSINDRNAETDAGDYQRNNWMPPAMGPETNHRHYGALTLDRPIGRPPIGGDYSQADRRTEVRQMASMGIGMVVDGLGIPDNNNEAGARIWGKITGYADAIAQEGLAGQVPFAIMWDGTGGQIQNATNEQLANRTQELFAKSAYHRVGGRFQVTLYGPEVMADGAARWGQIKATLEARGFPTDLTAVYTQAMLLGHAAPAFDPHVVRHGVWSGRDAIETNQSFAASKERRGAAKYIRETYGKGFMQSVAPGDVRPNAANYNNGVGLYWESEGLKHLTVAADVASIGEGGIACDWMQLPTWNDWSECAHICPSLNQGWAMADWALYQLIRFKTGTFPDIKRDNVFLAHRTQFHDNAGMTYTAGTQYSTRSARAGQTAAVDIVEATACPTQNSTLEIAVAGAVRASVAVPSGVPTRLTTPLLPSAPGGIWARLLRNGVVVDRTLITSPWWASHEALVQDMHYRIGSARRGWSSTNPATIHRTTPAIR